MAAVAKTTLSLTRADVVARALAHLGAGRYKEGVGGRIATNQSPFVAGECDCEGFVAWCIGVNRHQRGRIESRNYSVDAVISVTSVFEDARDDIGRFSRVTGAHRPGDLIVYPHRYTIGKPRKRVGEGHVGVIETVDENGRAKTVIDCASGRRGGAVRRRDAQFFFDRGAIVAKFIGLVDA